MAEKNHLRDFESTRTVFFAFAIFLLLAVFDHRRSRSITVDAARCRSMPLDPARSHDGDAGVDGVGGVVTLRSCMTISSVVAGLRGPENR
jgi:hypothetical protein